MSYKVARGASVLYKGLLLTPGQEIPGNLSALPELIRSGHVVKTEARDGSAEGEPKDVHEPPTIRPDTVVSEDGVPPPFTLKASTGPIEITAMAKPEAPAAPKAVSPGKWSLDPATLAGKPLEALNVMVLDKDPSIAPFETIGEAIAQLSLDFKKA